MATPQKLRIDVCLDWSASAVAKLIQEQHLDSNIVVGYKISNCQNLTVYGTNTLLEGFPISPEGTNPVVLSIDVSLPSLAPDDYFLTFAIQLASGKSTPAYVDMEWDDVCIQLRNEPNVGFEGRIGMVKCETNYSVALEK